jgi:hypothetical protein
LVNGEVANIYEGNEEFAKFVSEFLDGKPFWLRIGKTST